MYRGAVNSLLTPHPETPGRLRAHAPALLVFATLGLAFACGTSSCGDDSATGSPTSGPVGPGVTTGVGAGGAGGEGAGVPIGGGDARAYFEAEIQPGLLSECGACHQLQGAADAPFLAAPDIYSAITTYPGIVVPTVSQSILLTRPADPGHGAGNAPDLSPALRAKVEDWLAVESALIPDPIQSANVVVPFKPKLEGAFNTIYLGDLGQEYENVSITFNATELGTPPSMLLLENLEVHPISEMQIHLVHPLFTAYPSDGAEPVPDPADSFSLVDEVYSLDGLIQLGTGTFIHTAWSKDSYLSIAFEKVELVGDFFPPIDCKALATFQADVLPAMQICSTCHGGDNAQAQGAMDLSTLASDPAAACKQVRARIKAGNPDASQILIVTDPLDVSAHLYKFQGSLSNYNTFKNEVSPWIVEEDQ